MSITSGGVWFLSWGHKLLGTETIWVLFLGCPPTHPPTPSPRPLWGFKMAAASVRCTALPISEQKKKRLRWRHRTSACMAEWPHTHLESSAPGPHSRAIRMPPPSPPSPTGPQTALPIPATAARSKGLSLDSLPPASLPYTLSTAR